MSATDPPPIICPACEYPNSHWAITCKQCYSRLSHRQQTSRLTIQKPPGCIMLYILMIGFGATFLVIETFPLILLDLPLLMGCGWIFYGLWNGQNWARLMTIAVHGLLLIGTLLSWVVFRLDKPPADVVAWIAEEGRDLYKAVYPLASYASLCSLILLHSFTIYWFWRRWETISPASAKGR